MFRSCVCVSCVCVCAKYNNKKVSREKKQRRRKKSINTLCQIMYSCVGAYFHPRCVLLLCVSIQSGIRMAFMVKRQQHKHTQKKRRKFIISTFSLFFLPSLLFFVCTFLLGLLWLSIYLFSCYICVSMGVIWCVCLCVCACLFVWINVENLFFSYIFFSFHIILPLYPFVHNLIFRLGNLYL